MLNKSIINKKLHKGALFIEYALLLAMLLGVGVLFISSDSITDSIDVIFGKTALTMNRAVKNNASSNLFFKAKLCDSIIASESSRTISTKNYPSRKSIQSIDGNGDGKKLLALEPNSTYQITIDLQKLQDMGFPINCADKESYLGMSFMLFPNDKPNSKAIMDTGTINFMQNAKENYSAEFKNNRTGVNDPDYPDKDKANPYTVSYSKTGNTITYEFTTGSKAVDLGINFNTTQTNRGNSPDTEVPKSAVINSKYQTGVENMNKYGYTVGDIMDLQKTK